MNCKDFDGYYWQKVYGEPISIGEDAFQEHLESCPNCQARQRELDHFQALLTARVPAQPEPEMLKSAREHLVVRLRADEGSRSAWNIRDRIREWFTPFPQPLTQPALVLGSLLLGLIIGRYVLVSSPDTSAGMPLVAPVNSAALERHFITENIVNGGSQIQDVRVASLAPESGLLQVNFRATQDYQIEGSSSDDLINVLLTWAVKNESNLGARLNSVQELARNSEVSAVAREVLTYALINDSNDGVRLKALEALSEISRDEITEQAFVKALLKDSNPAIRIRAIDMLLAGDNGFKSTPIYLQAAEADSNAYVKMRARQAIKQSNFNMKLIQLHQ
ncbi:hypothetical protein CEE37_00460 [candidate division LCP-89 bacterium B3_LCP]|uniref:Zinc-finger domain-containing protein n=1 Tax=candidate division LCP-89 bacterium B3_LCP TaxID=2012998 RepID=A0A532V4Q9_UNCL8|nr:MAG: hypothetical protein CEE37_00460 [candidate division LCP-89 bacterium B3_LCP]